MRADARRNYEALVAAAREAFAEHGAEAPLDDIARRAGVGAGTLYRHFPNRDELLAAVYRADIEGLATRARELADTLPPDEAFSGFLRLMLDYSRFKAGLHSAIKQMLATRTDAFDLCRGSLNEAAQDLLARAQQAGVVREGVDAWTVVRLVHGVAMASEAAPETADLMLTVVADGLRTHPSPPSPPSP